MRRPASHAVIAIAALAAIYVVAARLGLMMDAVAGFATLVWPPTGIALVALIRFGPWIAPGVALGALVVNAWAGAPLGAAAGIAAGNTLEALAGVYLLQRLAFRPLLDRRRDVLGLVGAALLGALVAATLGVASLWAFGVVENSGAAAAWRAWWLGDVMGVLVVAPFLFALVAPVRTEVRGRSRIVEGIALLVALGASTFVAFGGWPQLDVPSVRLPYVVFPSLIWASLRFGARGAATGVLVVSAVAIATTSAGYGAFAGATLAESLFGLQAFMGIVAITILLLGAVSDERDEALQQRQQFLEIITHELKNPLSSVQLSTEPLLSMPDPIAKRAGIIKRAAERMSSLVQNLLDASAIEAGRLAVAARPEDARAIVSEALDSLAPLATAKSQTIDRDIPEAAVALHCDRDRVVQVLVNLVGNAIKFAPEGSAIHVALRADPQHVHLTIRDEGPGMSTEQVAHLFERYWQAQRDSRKGRGLGLFISKGLVEAHGGQLRVESRLGAGTTFHVTLPA